MLFQRVRGHHLKCVVLNCVVPFLSFFSATTRKVYEKKLQKLLDQPAAEPEAPADITTLPKADSNQNGNTNSDQYSDKEDGELRRHINRHPFFFFSYHALKQLPIQVLMVLCFPEDIAAPEPEPEPVPVVEKPVRSRGKTPVTTRTSSRRQAKVRHIFAEIVFKTIHCSSVFECVL